MEKRYNYIDNLRIDIFNKTHNVETITSLSIKDKAKY